MSQENKNVLADQQAVVSQHGGSKEIVNRREATQRISELSLALFATPLMAISHQLHKEEILALCATNIPICWRLYFDGHLSEVQHLLFPVHLSQLAALVEEAHFQEQAASLASKAYQPTIMSAATRRPSRTRRDRCTLKTLAEEIRSAIRVLVAASVEERARAISAMGQVDRPCPSPTPGRRSRRIRLPLILPNPSPRRARTTRDPASRR